MFLNIFSSHSLSEFSSENENFFTISHLRYTAGAGNFLKVRPCLKKNIIKNSGYFDKERKFHWWNGQLYPTFGKYAKKKHIKDIAREDREYLAWVLSRDFNEEVMAMVRKALDGDFPKPPEEL